MWYSPPRGLRQTNAPGSGWGEGPAGAVFDVVVVVAGGSEVGADGGAAGGVVEGVVQVGGGCAVPAAGEGAGAVADLGVAAQRGGGEPVVGVGVEVGEVVVAAGVLGGHVGDHPGPSRRPPARVSPAGAPPDRARSARAPAAPPECGSPRRLRVGRRRWTGNAPTAGGRRRVTPSDSNRPSASSGCREAPLRAGLTRDPGPGVGGGQQTQAGDLPRGARPRPSSVGATPTRTSIPTCTPQPGKGPDDSDAGGSRPARTRRPGTRRPGTRRPGTRRPGTRRCRPGYQRIRPRPIRAPSDPAAA